MLKGQKGITLVALVITIIVLIILAGISISLVLNNGNLVEKAKQGASNYQNAAAIEKQEIQNIFDYVNNPATYQ